MKDGRAEIVELGRWIAQERAKREHRGKPLSTGTLANFANAYIAARKLPVKQIHQQEISALESATLDKGPKRLQPWMTTLRDFIDDGELDVMLRVSAQPLEAGDAEVIVPFEVANTRRDSLLVRTPDGEVVGEVVWRH